MLFTLTPSAPVDGYGEAILPLSLAKQHLRVDWAEEDELILALRDAAIDMVEQYCNIRLGPVAGLVAAFGAFEPKLRLGVGPAFSIVINSVSYMNAGAETTLDPSAYRLAPGGVLMPASRACWPAADGDVTVIFDAGYPVNQAPPALIHAARLFLGHLYLNREAVITEGVSGELSLGFMDLCNRYRVPVI
ncbi:MAG: head-tail connector protein [Sphingomonas sp.]|nr:head-tail connector protein [Sphingomonas sp.]